MAYANLSQYNNLLKEVYLPPVRDLINNDTVLLDCIGDGDEHIDGKYAYVPLHTGRNEGLGARAESGTLPTPQSQGFAFATFGPTYFYGRIQITGPAMAATKRKGEAAFEDALDSEMRRLSVDLRNECNRMLWGTGSGILGVIETSGQSNTVNIQLFTNSAGVYTQSNHFIRKDQLVDIRLISTGAIATGGDSNTVVSFDPSTGIMVLSAAITATASSVYGVYREDSRNIEHYGVGSIISNLNPSAVDYTGVSSIVGNLGGIDRSTQPLWQSQVLGNSGTLRNLTLDIIQQLIDLTEINGPGPDLAYFITNHNIRRKYANLLTPDRRFQGASGSPIKLDGGWCGLSYNDIPWKVDKHASKHRLFLLSNTTLLKFMLADWDWMDKDGAILSRVSNKDEYEGTMFTYRQYGAQSPADSGVITDIKET